MLDKQSGIYIMKSFNYNAFIIAVITLSGHSLTQARSILNDGTHSGAITLNSPQEKQTLLQFLKTPFKRKRCGVTDGSTNDGERRHRRYIRQGTMWKKSILTWRIDSYSNDLPKHTIHHILKTAFRKWGVWIPISFQEKRHGKVDISIKFVKGIHSPCRVPFDGKDGSIAHAYYPYQGQEIAGDIHFDDAEDFKDGQNDGSGTSLAWTALHEIGHSLGLEHSYLFGAVMSPYYSSFYHPSYDELALTTDDIKGVQAIYGTPLVIAETNRVDTLPT